VDRSRQERRQLTLDTHEARVISGKGFRSLVTDFRLAADITSFTGHADTPSSMAYRHCGGAGGTLGAFSSGEDFETFRWSTSNKRASVPLRNSTGVPNSTKHLLKTLPSFAD
jgi:hypothetical protein